MTPSLYDLLDVGPDAGADEIRAAWRSAIADLDPSDRRFRAYNQAAETLLDPARRREYDESRAGGPDVSAATTETPTAAAAPVAPAATKPTRRPRLQRKARADGEKTEPRSEPVPAPIDQGESGGSDADDTARTPGRTPGRAISRATLLVVGLVTLVIVVAAAFYTWKAVDAAADQDRIEATERAATEAETAAAEAAVPLLSYDYRTLQSDVARALPFMTESRAAEYERLMEDLRPEARKQKIVVQADVTATGVVRAAEDRAQVLVYVDQATTKAGRETDPLQMWVTVTMVERDGSWLVDEMQVDQVLPG